MTGRRHQKQEEQDFHRESGKPRLISWIKRSRTEVAGYGMFMKRNVSMLYE